MKIGLVLEGGGVRGSYHVGAVLALKKKHIKINSVVGTSIGSINAAFVVMKDYYKLYQLWNSVTAKAFFGIDDDILNAVRNRKITKEIIKTGISTIASIIKNMGIDNTHLLKVLEENIDEEKVRKSNIDFGLCTYSLSDRKPIKLFKKDIPKGKLIEYIMASAYFPTFKLKRIIDEKYYIDGGVYDRCPVDMLLDKKFDKIYVIKAYTWDQRKISSNTTDIVYVKPKKSLGSLILVDKDLMEENIKKGYYDTLKVLDKLDGYDYYIKFKDEKYYEKYLLTKSSLLFKKGKTTKEKIINIVEQLAEEFDIPKYRVYNINILMRLIRIKIRKNKNHKYYDFVRKLNIRWW